MAAGSDDSRPDTRARPKPKVGRGRVDFTQAGRAGRAVLFAANRAELTVRQHRVLSAVVAFTALYSRVEDRVYLAQIAAFAHGVERALDWQVKKTRETLGELEGLGLIVKVPPRGRPPLGHEGPAYWIALGTPEMHPALGVTSSPESDPVPGSKVTPPPDRKAPRPRAEKHPGHGGEMHPAPGPPTEKTSEEAPEEPAEEGRRGRRARAQDVGSLAALLTERTTTDVVEIDRAARGVAELIIDTFGPAGAIAAVDQVLAESPRISYPGVVLDGMDQLLEETRSLEALRVDRRFELLKRRDAGAGVAFCDGAALINGTEWSDPDHVFDAELVLRHFDREEVPDRVRADIAALAADAGLDRPGYAGRLARKFLGDDFPLPTLPKSKSKAGTR